MNKTPNYNLSQWAKSDRVLMDDFNADNAKIDAALAGIAATVPKVCWGSYIGTGTYGYQSPTSLTLPFEPKLLVIKAATQTFGGHIWFCDAPAGLVYSNVHVPLVKQGSTMRWHGNNADVQLNSDGETYLYFAMG